MLYFRRLLMLYKIAYVVKDEKMSQGKNKDFEAMQLK